MRTGEERKGGEVIGGERKGGEVTEDTGDARTGGKRSGEEYCLTATKTNQLFTRIGKSVKDDLTSSIISSRQIINLLCVYSAMTRVIT